MTINAKENEVKKRSVLSLLAVISVFGIVAASPAGASAEVQTRLCKTHSSTYKCSSANTYPYGTIIKGKLSDSLIVERETSGFGEKATVDQCSASEFEGYTKEAAGLKSVQVQLTKFTVSGCVEPNTTISVYPGGNTTSPDLIYTEGSYMEDYGFWHAGSTIKFGLGYLFGAPQVTCEYRFGLGIVTPGLAPTLRWGKAKSSAISTNPAACPANFVKVSGTYSITTPTPLYVEEA